MPGSDPPAPVVKLPWNCPTASSVPVALLKLFALFAVGLSFHVIVAFAGKDVASAVALQSAVDARRPGDRVTITILREGKRQTVDVTLATRPS